MFGKIKTVLGIAIFLLRSVIHGLALALLLMALLLKLAKPIWVFWPGSYVIISKIIYDKGCSFTLFIVLPIKFITNLG